MSYPEQPQTLPAEQYPAQPYPGPQHPTVPPERPKTGPLSVVAFVLSFFLFGIFAVILGVFALRQNWAKGYRGNGLAWAGIIIGAVHWVLAFGVAYLLSVMFAANPA